MSLEDLQKRVKVLEDIEEIKKLKIRYAEYCDINAEPDAKYSAEKIASLFTEDAPFDPGPLGNKAVGREAIRQAFTKAPEWMSFAVHMVVDPVIEVDGDKAKGTWILLQPATLSQGEKAIWGSGRYYEEYTRVNGEWKISSWKMISFFWTPFDQGWAQKKFFSQ